MKEKKKFRRLFFDIETSPNIVFSWNVGYKLNIDHANIIQERAIICICWKWADEKTVHSLSWTKGDDKKMLKEFIDVINSADEVIGHNGDNYDIKWLRTRCLFHGIPAFPKYQSLDTLKLARANFRFNSNRLDYIGRFLGVGGKSDTGGFKTWKSIILDDDKKAMDTMVKYCKIDVIRLQQIYDKLNPYTAHKSHVAVATGGHQCDCPNCASTKTYLRKRVILASGTKKIQMHCQECGKHFTVAERTYLLRNK